ncbi:MAG: RagB/SusD family nutrient uptake outer membrane protein [Tidjanibacter sp.]|nr:RagB/SusD family nutrient uptake outer membrane protein [Tidjanibacter sp.]
MKKIKSQAILIVSTMMLGWGCSDFLAENPKDQIFPADAYATPELIYANAVANIYTLIGSASGYRGLAGTDRSLYDICELASDEFILPTRGGDWSDGGLWAQLYQLDWSTDNGIIKDSWNYLYEVVGKCNSSIDLLSGLLADAPDNDNYKKYIAELRSLRAMYYYYLLDMYARVPLVVSSKTKMSDVRQSDRKEVFEFAVKELQESVELLATDHSNLAGSYYGRMTQGVGYFLLAKLAINAQVFNDNDWTDNNGVPNGAATIKENGTDVNAWGKVVEYCDAVTGLGYDLEKDFSTNFAVANETSVENIFVIPMDPTLYSAQMYYMIRSLNYSHGAAYGYDAWNGASLTKEAYAVFKTHRDTYGDTRLSKSFYDGAALDADGKQIADSSTGVKVIYQPENVKLDLSGDAAEKLGGARWAKYEIDKAATEKGKLQHNDYVLFRYADVLLMKAEANVRNGVAAGDALSKVRQRSGSTYTGETLDDILNERLLELSWENWRRNDLVRFGKFTKTMGDRPTVSAHKIVFPIPEDVMKTMEGYTQNKDY